METACYNGENQLRLQNRHEKQKGKRRIRTMRTQL